MRKLITVLVAIAITITGLAQSPQKMSYQAVIRNSSNALITSSPIGMQVSILQGSATGTEVYKETYNPNPQTNANGLVTVEIGSGIASTGTFSSIDWANGPYFIKTETDPTGGTNYTITGISQLLSVPYALHSKTAESLTGTITETDPVFGASPANGIFSSDIVNWNAAYGWGNHATAGYLTSFTETDPIFGASPANGITSTNITNWNAAYGWGNHATAGYLTNFTEADPIFGASPANGITSTNITNWNTAYGWGNHATAGYLTSFTETDPIFTASPSHGISSTNITNWNSAYGWGNHAGLYRPVTWVPLWTDVTGKPTFATVATTGSYNDLTNKLTAGNGITINGSNQVSVNVTSQAAGDMMYFDGTNWLRVPKGVAGQLLTMNSSGVPQWQDIQIGQPTAITSSATSIGASGVTLNGSANANGLATVVTFEYGTTTAYGSTINASANNLTGYTPSSENAILTGLTLGTTYHFRIKSVSAIGTSYGNDFTFTYLYYGASYQGGLVFYIDGTGQHGMICNTSDLVPTQGWGCSGTLITGADGTAVGTGAQNTLDIVAGCATANIAATYCNNLVLNTYSDWFLPSRDEYLLMYSNLKVNGFGGFSIASPYFTSSELDATNAIGVSFNAGSTPNEIKGSVCIVRAARAF